MNEQEIRCALCEKPVALVDEHGRCEWCVIEAKRLAKMLCDIEERFAGWLNRGLDTLSRDQLRRAVEMMVSNMTAELPGTALGRERVTTSERGIWTVRPSSTLDHYAYQDHELSPLRRLRHAHALALEDVAEYTGTLPATVALWELGGEVPADQVDKLADWFAVSPAYLVQD